MTRPLSTGAGAPNLRLWRLVSLCFINRLIASYVVTQREHCYMMMAREIFTRFLFFFVPTVGFVGTTNTL